jgi:hypothetical protein
MEEQLKFNLDEAFDLVYSQLLEDRTRDDIDSLVDDINTSTNDMLEALDLLEDDHVGETRIATIGGGSGHFSNGPRQDGSGDKPRDDAKPEKSATEKYAAVYDSLVDKINKQIADNITVSFGDRDSAAKNQQKNMAYQPAVGYEVTEKISDMKFPQNIIFFIKSLITWIKNNLLNFIDKCSNIIRSLLGLSAGKDRFSPDDLKLKLAKSKEIENHYLVNTQGEAYKKVNSTSDMLNGESHYSAAIQPVMMMDVSAKDVKPLFGLRENGEKYVQKPGLLPLTEEAETLLEFGGADVKGDDRTPVIRIDTSNDLLQLKESLNHFFDLYDNAYGSNNEDMFSTTDIQLELALFKDALDRIQHPSTTNAVQVGNAIEYDGVAVSSQKLKDNLLRTKVNTDNLKKAYTITNQQINTIARIIANKNIIGITQMGVQYAMLSASTYSIMIEMLDDIDGRIKEASKTEKDLQKMKDAFNKLTDELDKKRTIISAGSTMAYTTALERKIDDMYDGARYMTQTVQLRLDALALYLSELNDTRAVLKNLNAINTVNFPTLKTWAAGVSTKFKNLFNHGPEFGH